METDDKTLYTELENLLCHDLESTKVITDLQEQVSQLSAENRVLKRYFNQILDYMYYKTDEFPFEGDNRLIHEILALQEQVEWYKKEFENFLKLLPDLQISDIITDEVR